ncbi:hypothetical protein TrispH2_002628 [Trichoplax sp. H2]|nr:hypothetical protein TrispH2_002628 [Trichoplax sp. H2]|eukprot:RDD45424.1 hypothetical protein TrispH2_002628 [Trichoplax sp. H2]
MTETEEKEIMLEDLFSKCDRDHDGLISLEECQHLCEMLDVNQQWPQLEDRLLFSTADQQITYEQFQDAFVSVLMHKYFHNDDQSVTCSTCSEFSSTDSISALTRRHSLCPSVYLRGSSSRVSISSTQTNFESDDDNDSEILIYSDDNITKIQAHDVLRGVWLQIKSDESQCLELNEFRDVCQRFGMKDINENFRILFEELDSNHDGLLSFQEFLSGLDTIQLV